MQAAATGEDTAADDASFNPFQDFLAAGGFLAEEPLAPAPTPAPTPAVAPQSSPAAAPAAVAPPSDDLFGASAFGALPSTAPQATPKSATAAPAPAPAPAPTTSADDFFGSFGAPTSQAAAPKATPTSTAAAPPAAASSAFDAWGMGPTQAQPAAQAIGASQTAPVGADSNPWGPTAFGSQPAAPTPALPTPSSAVGGFGERRAMQTFPQPESSPFSNEFADAFAVAAAVPKPATPPPGRPMRPKSSAANPLSPTAAPPAQAAPSAAPTSNGALPVVPPPTQAAPTAGDPWAAAFGLAPPAQSTPPAQPPQAAAFPADSWAAFPETGAASAPTSSTSAAGPGAFDMFGSPVSTPQQQTPTTPVIPSNTADDEFWSTMGQPAKPTVQLPGKPAESAPASSLKLGAVMSEADRQKCEGAWQAKVRK